MTGNNPYFVKKGRVDEDGHIRAVDSSLRIMHNPLDVYGNLVRKSKISTSHDPSLTIGKISGNDAETGPFTYPAPSEHVDGDEIIAGYYHTEERMDLIGLTPPSSPVDNLALPPTAAANGAQEVQNGMQVPEPTFTSTLRPQQRSVQTNTNITNPTPPLRSIYSQNLPYVSPYALQQDNYTPPPRSIPTTTNTGTATQAPPNSYATTRLLASLPTPNPQIATAPMYPSTTLPQTANYPYRPTTGPTIFAGLPILSRPLGPKVNQPIPSTLHPVITAINNLPKIGHTGHPERKILKKPYEGSYADASRDKQLIRDHFASGSGLLRGDSQLREWYGDARVFEARMWEFLAVQRARK